MAHKYNIADLTKVANGRLGCQIPFCYDSELVRLVQLVCKTAPASCKDIRSVLVAECIYRMNKLIGDDEFVALLEQYADFGAHLALEGYKIMSIQVSSLEEQMDAQKKICLMGRR